MSGSFPRGTAPLVEGAVARMGQTPHRSHTSRALNRTADDLRRGEGGSGDAGHSPGDTAAAGNVVAGGTHAHHSGDPRSIPAPYGPVAAMGRGAVMDGPPAQRGVSLAANSPAPSSSDSLTVYSAPTESDEERAARECTIGAAHGPPAGPTRTPSGASPPSGVEAGSHVPLDRAARQRQRRGRRTGGNASASPSASSSPNVSSNTASALSENGSAGRAPGAPTSTTASTADTSSTSYTSSYSPSSSSSSSTTRLAKTVDALSRTSQRSQPASSRLAEAGGPRFPVGLRGRPSPVHSPTARSRDDGVARTQDLRSPLVSTVDVEVAMAKHLMRRRQNAVYLQARWSHMRRAAAGQDALYMSAVASGVYLDPNELHVKVDAGDLCDAKARTDTVYKRNLEALVELYLSSTPMYAAALAKFRSHLPPDEQRLRTRDSVNAYQRAARSAATGIDAHPTDSDSIKAGGGEWWQLQREDIELLGTDAARRARFLDDTLPWRPTDFHRTNLQLEPLEHHRNPHAYEEFHSGGAGSSHTASAVSSPVTRGGPVASPSVGGSVNLLVEMLILAETDPPYVSGVPAVNFTNSFLVLASYFVMPDVLVVKFIRLFRSIRRWGANPAECGDEHRPRYLLRRLLQCLLAYCRYHEMDLTLANVQRLAWFIESSGYANPLAASMPRPPPVSTGSSPAVDEWPCTEGVYDARRTAAQAAAAGSSTYPGTGTSAGESVAAPAPFTHAGVGSGGGSAPRPLPPLDVDVAQALLELSLWVRQFFNRHYRLLPVVEPSAGAAASTTTTTPTAPAPVLCTVIGSAESRHRLGTMYTAAAAALRARGPAGRGGVALPASPNATAEGSRGRRFPTSAVVDVDGEEDGESDGDVDGDAASTSGRGGVSVGDRLTADGREAAARYGDAERARASAADASRSASRSKGTRLYGSDLHSQLRPVDIDAEQFANQLSLLAFSLFSSVHLRELMHNAWADPDMQRCVSLHLHELIEYNTRLQRWTAAAVVTPGTWSESQQALRHLLEVCRRLYEQQNYQTASAMLGGLRHPAVEVVEMGYASVHGEPMLSESEQREMDTLQELMNPFASYSPSSLNSVLARAAGDMELPMIPLLSPVLGVLFRTEDSKGRTVTVRASDGQAIVNWSKIMGISKIVFLWLRCQYTPYNHPVDAVLQEYLWSIRHHQWTDNMLVRFARRAKSSGADDTSEAQ